MNQPTVVLPLVLGASLAVGLTLALRTDYAQRFDSFNADPRRKHPGKQSLTNKFKRIVAGITQKSGTALVSKAITGEGKRQVATLTGAVLRDDGGIIFTRVAIHARWLEDPKRRWLGVGLRTMVEGHALQRAIQAFHTDDCTVLAPEFHAHAGARVVYTMTERGLGIWLSSPSKTRRWRPQRWNRATTSTSAGPTFLLTNWMVKTPSSGNAG